MVLSLNHYVNFVCSNLAYIMGIYCTCSQGFGDSICSRSSASWPRRASRSASISVFQVMLLPTTKPSSHWDSIFSQQVSASLWHEEFMLSISAGVNFSIRPTLLHFAPMSSMTKILFISPFSSLYLKQVNVAMSGLKSRINNQIYHQWV